MEKNSNSKTENTKREMSAKESLLGCLLHLIPIVGIFVYQYFYPPEKPPEGFNSAKSKEYFQNFIDSEYHPQLERKVKELDEMTKNINELLYFIEYQKDKLKNEDKMFQELTKKNEDLEPIVNAKEELVNALFETHEKRQNAQRRYDWVWGFIVGVLSSLTASAIIYIYRKFKLNKEFST